MTEHILLAQMMENDKAIITDDRFQDLVRNPKSSQRLNNSYNDMLVEEESKERPVP